MSVATLRGRHLIALAYHFGIKPWEIDRLSIHEFYALCDACESLNDQQKASDTDGS